MKWLSNHITKITLSLMTLVIAIQWLVIFNQARVSHVISNQVKERTAGELHEIDEIYQRLKREALTRVSLYDELIKQHMLKDGMTVNRTVDGKAIDLCDSLLFSALRYRSLTALGMQNTADLAWASLLKSRQMGQWFRHPQCKEKALSRDMFMGLMVALEASPKETRSVLIEAFNGLDRRNGYVGKGPFYVSFLSPGPAGLLRALAERHSIPFDQWPWSIQQSFSSIEYDALFLKPGFESHLAGLTLWLESRLIKNERGFNPRSLLGEIEKGYMTLSSKTSPAIDQQRRLWIATKLAQDNPKNLFFTFLRQRFEGSESLMTKSALLSQLLKMPQFPSTRLPTSCDRQADYIWQRKDEEQSAPSYEDDGKCLYTFAGVDFMWMASILISDDM